MYQISTDLRLSEHFVLREFVRSATAQRLHIDNTPQACHVARLIALCEHVLEPLRREFGPLVINSGYRCTALNRAVGGVPHSQHLRGEAADVRTRSTAEARRMFDFVRRHLVFDQVLLERNRRTGSVWLHVSYRRDEGANRRQALHLSVAENIMPASSAPLNTNAPLPHIGTAMALLATPPATDDTRRCTCCGQTLDATHFALLPSGNRRGMCNHCRWLQHIQPSRHKAWLRG